MKLPKSQQPPESPAEAYSASSSSASGSQRKPVMLVNAQELYSKSAVQMKIRECVMQLFKIQGFPYYKSPVCTADGQPYFSVIDRVKPLLNPSLNEIKKETEERHAYRLAPNLYAGAGPMRFGPVKGQGIKDLASFLSQKALGHDSQQRVFATLDNIFVAGLA